MENTMEKRIPVIIPAYEPDEKMIRLLQTLQESGIERIVVEMTEAERSIGTCSNRQNSSAQLF